MTLLYAMTDYVKWNACLRRKKMEKYQNNKWALGKWGRGVVQQKAFCELLAEVIFCAQRCREIVRDRGSASVSQLVIALSQSMEPWKPSQRWASLLCSSWRACFISLCSSSTLTSKLINSRLLFLPLGYEGVSIKISLSCALDVSSGRNHGTQEAVTVSRPLRTLALKLIGLCVPLPRVAEWWDIKLSTAYRLRAWNWPLTWERGKREIIYSSEQTSALPQSHWGTRMIQPSIARWLENTNLQLFS